MSQLLQFTLVSTKLFFRNREAVMWNLAFPTFLFLIYVTVFSGMYGPKISHQQAVADNLAKILAINFVSGGVFSIGIGVAVLKEKGILRRYKVTPVRPLTIVLGIVIRQYLFMLITTVLLIGLALVVYRAQLAGNLLDWFVSSSLGILVFCALGFCVAGISNSAQSAVGFANLLFMPMLFLSGAAIPAFLFPKWLKTVSSLLPATHLTNLLEGVFFKGNPLVQNSVSLLVLAGFGLAFVTLAALVSRWE